MEITAVSHVGTAVGVAALSEGLRAMPLSMILEFGAPVVKTCEICSVGAALKHDLINDIIYRRGSWEREIYSTFFKTRDMAVCM